MWINLLVALSNLAGLYWIPSVAKEHAVFLWMPMVASFVYHVAETKHDLPGFPLFNSYAYPLLMVDRAMAMVSLSYMCLSLLYAFGWIEVWALATTGRAVLAVVCLAASECPGVPQGAFVVLHMVWHGLAFSILGSGLSRLPSHCPSRDNTWIQTFGVSCLVMILWGIVDRKGLKILH
jgi:hypothetical protein